MTFPNFLMVFGITLSFWGVVITAVESFYVNKKIKEAAPLQQKNDVYRFKPDQPGVWEVHHHGDQVTIFRPDGSLQYEAHLRGDL